MGLEDSEIVFCKLARQVICALTLLRQHLYTHSSLALLYGLFRYHLYKNYSVALAYARFACT